MSKSRKKTPIFGNATPLSEKTFKSTEHRRERRLVKVLLSVGKEDLPHPKQFGNPWAGPKDGKIWWASKKWKKVWVEEIGCHMPNPRSLKLYTKYMRK